MKEEVRTWQKMCYTITIENSYRQTRTLQATGKLHASHLMRIWQDKGWSVREVWSIKGQRKVQTYYDMFTNRKEIE